jgi:GNAT superfamily N-acetyltransferase
MIRAARVNEAAVLSQISLQSKRYWNYPEEYYRLWEKELLITPEYIKTNVIFVYERQGKPVAYYSIVQISEDMKISGITITQGYWLDHMFVRPKLIGSGLGRQMFTHLSDWCLSKSVERIHLLADPHSRGFYEKMGCEYQQEYPSTIPGRTTPLFLFRIGVR